MYTLPSTTHCPEEEIGFPEGINRILFSLCCFASRLAYPRFDTNWKHGRKAIVNSVSILSITISHSFVSFSRRKQAQKSVSHYYTKALSNRVIVHLSKCNRVRVRSV